jgi:hypothetical protein
MMRRAVILCAMLLIAPVAVPTPSADIDCGTLSGRGVVRLHIGDVIYRVAVDCGVRT